MYVCMYTLYYACMYACMYVSLLDDQWLCISHTVVTVVEVIVTILDELS